MTPSRHAEADAPREAADSVFTRHHPPAVVADSRVALHLESLDKRTSQRADEG